MSLNYYKPPFPFLLWHSASMNNHAPANKQDRYVPFGTTGHDRNRKGHMYQKRARSTHFNTHACILNPVFPVGTDRYTHNNHSTRTNPKQLELKMCTNTHRIIQFQTEQLELKMDDQCLSRDHRAAIALNNMGVSLLERRAYRQGMETLKDAIFVMKCVLRPPSISSSQGLCKTPNSTSYAEAKVHLASKRMANPQPISSKRSIDVLSQCATFSHRSCPSDSVLQGGSSSSPLSSPLRIELTDLVSLEDRDSDLESSIMLYNFGLAHLCMAKVVKTPIKLQKGALTLFNMAYSIFAPRCDKEGQGIREDVVLLAAATSTLDNIVVLLTRVGKHSETNESDHELARLGRTIQELQGRYHLEDQIATAAAA
jgi:hypothetical protein